MIAYKFYSSTQFAWALDIVFNRRLHCADWSTFNDPREGFFEFSQADDQKAQAIKNAKTKYRICCLSKSIGSRLLWAHYASGFDGLAVEVKLPTQEQGKKFYEVTYDDTLPSVAQQRTALSYLTRKDGDWKYEDEVRIIQKGEWYKLHSPVKRAIVGSRFNKSLLRALRVVCEQESIVLHCTRIEGDGVVAVDCPDL